MPTQRLVITAQSNGALPWTPDGVWANPFLPLLQAIIDPGTANGITCDFIAAPMDGGTAPASQGTLCSSTGVCIGFGAMTEAADGYMGTATSDTYIRPRQPAHPSFGPADWPTWPLTNRGEGMRLFLASRSAQVKAEAAAILHHHWEWDGNGSFDANAAWVAGDLRVLEFGLRREYAMVRQELGRTPAETPVFFVCPGPLSNRAQGENGTIRVEGYQYLRRVYERLAGDPAFNARVLDASFMDSDWDREWLVDQTGGQYGPHGNISDYRQMARRIAYELGNLLGPVWNPAGWTARTRGPAAGPRAYHAQWIDPTTIDVWIAHDGSTDIVLVGTSTVGWHVTYDGQAVTVASVVRQAPNVLRLTLAASFRCAELLRVGFATTGLRVRMANKVLDNRLAVDGGRLVPASITGADRIEGHLQRNLVPLRVARTAPSPVL
jgi:hypothetical protein